MVKLYVRISGLLFLNFQQVILTFGTGQRLNERQLDEDVQKGPHCLT